MKKHARVIVVFLLTGSMLLQFGGCGLCDLLVTGAGAGAGTGVAFCTGWCPLGGTGIGAVVGAIAAQFVCPEDEDQAAQE